MEISPAFPPRRILATMSAALRHIRGKLKPNGRTLGRVWCGGIDANAEQVRRGMAWVFDRYVKDRSLYPLQDVARSAGLGLWADATPIPPWQWRQERGALEYRGR